MNHVRKIPSVDSYQMVWSPVTIDRQKLRVNESVMVRLPPLCSLGWSAVESILNISERHFPEQVVPFGRINCLILC